MQLMRVPFRIRRVYFDQIVARTKTSEIRRSSWFWRRIINHAESELASGRQVIAVFVCGKSVYRCEITDITRFATAELALGRKPSPQGRRDLGRGAVYKFSLGKKFSIRHWQGL